MLVDIQINNIPLKRPQHDLIYESILAMVNHLYWSNITIVNNVVDCLNTMAQIYTEDIDPDGVR